MSDQFYVHVPGNCPCGLTHSVQGADELNARQGLGVDTEDNEASGGIYDKIIEPSESGPDPLIPRPKGGGE